MADASHPEVSRKTVGRGALWSLAGVGAGQGVALLTFLVTARYVSKESFGVMALSLGIVELLKRAGIESFAFAVGGRVDAEAEDYDACFALTLASTALMVAAALLCAEAVARIRGEGPVVDALRLAAALVLTGGLWRTHEVWLARHMRFRTLAIRSIAAAGAGGVVGIAMALRGFELSSLVGQQLATGGLSLVLLWATTPWRPRLSVPAAALRRNLADAKHLSLSGLGTFFSTETDIIVASTVLGIAPAGVYNAAKRLTLALNLFLTSSIQNVTLSAFANIADAENRRRTALRAMGVVAAATMPAAFGTIALARPIVQVLLGDRWLSSAPVLSALAISVATVSMMQFDTALFMVGRRLPEVTRYAMLSSALNLVALPLAALGGETVLALGASAVQLVVYPLATRSALRVAGIAPRACAEAIGKPFLAAAAMGALVGLAEATSPLHGLAALAVLIPAGAVAYVALLAVLSPGLTRELLGLAGSILQRRRVALG